MSLTFVHFNNSNDGESATSMEKALFTLRSDYLETLHLQTIDPSNSDIPLRYIDILNSPLMEGISTNVRDLRLELQEASCWGLACYNDHSQNGDLALGWLFKNLASRIYLWNHPNCVKVLEKIVRIAWEKRLYHVCRWASHILEFMIKDSNENFSMRFLYLQVSTLFIIGEWNEMTNVIKRIQKIRKLDKLSLLSSSIISMQPKDFDSQFDIDYNEMLSEEDLNHLLLIGKMEQSNLSSQNNIHLILMNLLPKFLHDRRKAWYEFIHSNNQCNKANIKPAPTKIIFISILQGSQFYNLARILHKIYKRYSNQEDLNQYRIQFEKHPLPKRVTVQSISPQITISRKRQREDAELKKPKKKKVQNPFQIDLISMLKDPFVESRNRSFFFDDSISENTLQKDQVNGGKEIANLVRNTSHHSTELELNNFIEDVNSNSFGLLDTIHFFLEYSITKLSTFLWSKSFKMQLLRLVELLYKRHCYKFTPDSSLHIAELFFDEYQSLDIDGLQKYKILAHRICSDCIIFKFTSNINKRIRLNFLYGDILSRTNPSLASTYFEECLKLMDENNCDCVEVPNSTSPEQINKENIRSKIRNMKLMKDVSSAEKLIMSGNFINGLNILDKISKESSISQEVQVQIRDLYWISLLTVSEDELFNIQSITSIIATVFEQTPTYILGNYLHTRIALSRICTIVEKLKDQQISFSSTQRICITKKLFSVLEKSFDDYKNAFDKSSNYLLENTLNCVKLARAIGTFFGSSSVSKLHSSYRSLFILQQIIFQTNRIPKDKTSINYLISEYFKILKECRSKILSLKDEECHEYYEWTRLKTLVRYSISSCLYTLYGIVLIDPRDSAFTSWKQEIDFAFESKNLTVLIKFPSITAEHSKVAFYVIEDYANKHLGYETNPQTQLEVNQILCTIFNSIESEISVDPKNIIDIETQDGPWYDEGILNSMKIESSLQTAERDADYKERLYLLLAKTQLKLAQHGAETEKLARCDVVFNIIRHALAKFPKNNEAWHLLGELYYSLLQMHLEHKLRHNEELVLREPLRSSLKVIMEEESLDLDLELCTIRALRCFFIAYKLNDQAHQSVFNIANLLFQLLRWKIIPSIFQTREQILDECSKYIQVLQNQLSGETSSRFFYLSELLKEKVKAVFSTLSFEEMIHGYKTCYSICKEFCRTMKEDSIELEEVKRDLSEILESWTTILFQKLNEALQSKSADRATIETFLLENIYRIDPKEELQDAPNIGYLQGIAIPMTYIDIVPIEEADYKSLSKRCSLLWNLLYQSYYECLKIDPYNYKAVFNLAAIISSKQGPWKSDSTAQRVLCSLFKQKVTGSTKRPELYEFNIKDRSGCEDLVGVRNVLTLLLNLLSNTNDVKVVGLLLAGLRRTYISYGESMVELYIKGIQLLIKFVDNEMQQKKGKELTKEKDLLLKLSAIAYIYIRDTEIDQFSKENEAYKKALEDSNDILMKVVKRFNIKLSLNKKINNVDVLVKYYKQKGLNLTRRKRTTGGKPFGTSQTKVGSAKLDDIPHFKQHQEANEIISDDLEKSKEEEDIEGVIGDEEDIEQDLGDEEELDEDEIEEDIEEDDGEDEEEEGEGDIDVDITSDDDDFHGKFKNYLSK